MKIDQELLREQSSAEKRYDATSQYLGALEHELDTLPVKIEEARTTLENACEEAFGHKFEGDVCSECGAERG